jgi:uncharacterized protein YndB with AHSA1/START domain
MTARKKSARSTARRKTTKRAKRTTTRRKAEKPLAKAARGLRAARKRAGEVGDAAVRRATGKPLSHWFKVLDRAGAKAMDHGKIVELLGKGRVVSGWWRQMITVAYERARGLRQKYQTARGFNANASKTVSAPIAELYAAWVDEAKQREWLGVPLPEVRTATTERSLRLTWHDGSWVIVGFEAKGTDKSLVSVSHEKLPNARAVLKYKGYWNEALGRLAALVEQGVSAPAA